MVEAQFVEAQRHGDFDINRDEANGSGDQLSQLTGTAFGAGQDGAAAHLLDNAGKNVLQNHAMTGDVPARVEPHLAFGIGENLDALGIETVETSVCQHVPMRGLQVLQTLESGFRW